MEKIRVLITGQNNDLIQPIAGALSAAESVRASATPPDARLLQALRKRRYDAVIFALSGWNDIEPLRWMLAADANLPVLAVLPRATAGLKRKLRTEGVARVLGLKDIPEMQVRGVVLEILRELQSEGRLALPSRLLALPQLEDNLHAARSALTEIQGNAEMALRAATAPARRKHLHSIGRTVREVEQILQRIEKKLQNLRPWCARPIGG